MHLDMIKREIECERESFISHKQKVYLICLIFIGISGLVGIKTVDV